MPDMSLADLADAYGRWQQLPASNRIDDRRAQPLDPLHQLFDPAVPFAPQSDTTRVPMQQFVPTSLATLAGHGDINQFDDFGGERPEVKGRLTAYVHPGEEFKNHLALNELMATMSGMPNLKRR
jgi:hypothetical protein